MSEERDITHAQEIANRIVGLMEKLELFLSRDAEKACRKQAEQLANRDHVHALRREVDSELEDDDYGALLWEVPQ